MAAAATAAARVLRLRWQVIGADDCIFVRLWMRRNSVRGSSGWLIENEHVLCETKQIRERIRTKYSELICSDLGPMPTQQSSEVVSALPPINRRKSEKWCLEILRMDDMATGPDNGSELVE